MHRRATAAWVGAMALIVIGSSHVRGADREGVAFFESKVRPILVGRCLECHGATSKVKAGLTMTSREAILKGGDSGPAAVVGKPQESLLVEVLGYIDEPKMPPKGKLPDSEVATLSRWIEMGLPWPEGEAAKASTTAGPPAFRISDEQKRFWSFQPVRGVKPPEVEHPELAPTAIDHFLQSALEAKGIAPSGPADRLTLIRRATFDLTGLPPTPEEVQAFLDDNKPDAFERVVERLLSSPQYGERWGRHWLDLVRYADSRDSRGLGSESDILEAWHYRDWVVSAFNRDLPYDEFIRRQVAGDLMQPADPKRVDVDALVATGLLTIGEWGTGDADKEKMMTDIVADQIDVVGRAFLGLTIACARCHDHKFDPIAQEDYYGLAGIFFSTRILPEPGAKTGGSPMLRTPLASKATIAAAEAHRKRMEALQAEVTAFQKTEVPKFLRAEAPKTSAYLLAAWDATAGSDGKTSAEALAKGRGLNGPILRRWIASLGFGGTGTLLVRPVERFLGAAGVDAWAGPEDTPSLTVNRNASPVQILSFTLPARSVNLHPSPSKPVALTWTSPISGEVTLTGSLNDADPSGGDGVGWRVEVWRKNVWTELAGGDLPNGTKAELDPALKRAKNDRVKVEPGDAIRLVVSPKASHVCDTTTVTWKIAAKGEAWDASADLVPDLLAGGKGNPHADLRGKGGVWSVAEIAETGSNGVLASLPGFAAWQAALKTEKPDRAAVAKAANALQADLTANTPEAKTRLDGLIRADGPFWLEPAEYPEELRRPIAGREAELANLRAEPPAAIPVGLIAQDGGVPRSEYEGVKDSSVHVRGDYKRRGRVVPRRFPLILAGETSPPFPSKESGRRELADWIARGDNPMTARVMVNRIWQFHFGEGLVRTPSNFGKLGERPSHPELLDWLAGEFVRSGWSVKAMHRAMMLTSAYQRSSRPTAEARKLDPENLWLAHMPRRRIEAEELRDSLLAVSGRLDLKGGGPADRDFAVPRRTLYQISIRSDRSSYNPLFDAADPAAVIDKRAISTVAPQALFLLNNKFVLDQAQALTDRVLKEEADEARRLDRLYRLLFGRSPTPEEAAIGRSLVGSSPGEPARNAWASYVQVLLCSNEFVFVD